VQRKEIVPNSIAWKGHLLNKAGRVYGVSQPRRSLDMDEPCAMQIHVCAPDMIQLCVWKHSPSFPVRSRRTAFKEKPSLTKACPQLDFRAVLFGEFLFVHNVPHMYLFLVAACNAKEAFVKTKLNIR
jgi:hypothetical protein